MTDRNDVPDDGEEEPGDKEGGGKAEQGGAPRQVDHRREEVFQIPENVDFFIKYKNWMKNSFGTFNDYRS